MSGWSGGSGRHLAVAVLASLVVVFGSPAIGALRSAVFVAFPTQYRYLMRGAVLCLAVALVIGCAGRIRDRRVSRFAWLVASVVLAVLVSRAMRSGDANIDAVEAFHFVEYGVLTVLFHRVWRPVSDISSWASPALAAAAVAICDEWFQWFVPLRAGEMRDVWMNAASIVCGLFFAMALAPAERPLRRRPGTSTRLGLAASAVALLGAGFFSTVHLGYQIRDAEIGTFVSTDTGEALIALGRARHQKWRGAPPLARPRMSREDQYLSEALWHVQRRNDAYADGDFSSAWGENRVLEKFYAPVLDAPSYASATGLRWPEEQRQTVEVSRQRSVAFVSLAHPYPIYTWSKGVFWLVVGIASTATSMVAWGLDRRADGGAGTRVPA